jgi:hypothetical protein
VTLDMACSEHRREEGIWLGVQRVVHDVRVATMSLSGARAARCTLVVWAEQCPCHPTQRRGAIEKRSGSNRVESELALFGY